MTANNLTTARAALVAGDLHLAESLLPTNSISDLDAACLKCEVLFARGSLHAARRLVTEISTRFQLKQEEPARITFIAGACAWELEGEETGTQFIKRALESATVSKDVSLQARVRLFLLERMSSSGTPYHTSLPACADAVRAVHSSGDKGVLIEAHITFARLEAKAGALEVANRHLNLAERLLTEAPNRRLSASVRLTRATVLSLQGDIDTARELTESATRLASEAGWTKGEAIAAGNLAFFHACYGDLENAKKQLLVAENAGYQSPSFSYALLDTKMALAIRSSDYGAADRLWKEAESRSRNVGSWYKLRAAHTRVRGLVRQHKTEEALRLATLWLDEARRSENSLFEYVFELSIAELRAREGNVAVPLELGSGAQASLGLVGARRFILAESLARAGDSHAVLRLEAAARILFAAGALSEWGGDETPSPIQPAADLPQLEALDDAVALIELAGYPHVLAREAYALLDLSGAATALALVARSESAIRAVTARGWTHDEAVAAATDPGDRLRIVCGVHRDESWEIVADLKPALNDRCTGVAIRKLVDTAVTLDRYRREEKQRAALWPADTLETDGGLWVSEQMTELLSLARRIAPADITVLLTGETGTGKEVLARAIHRASGRAGKPFVPFNCTAVPREMLESQLFGYRKGAFTGADTAFEGVIRAAAGGTLFLDEIAEIGPDLQPKLLRFLETHEVHGLGEAQPVKVDVRIVAATNADIETLVSENRFREDLFYRLNVVRLRLPPLRERREEIPPLIDHYLRKFADEQKKGRLTLDDETLEYLVLYAWPGNVRQLVNEISRVVAYAEPDGTITPALLSPEIQASRRTVRVMPGDEPEIRVRLDQPLNDAVDAIERVMVLRALDRAHGNYENAAKLLGISRKGLFLKRRRWGLQRAQAS